MDAEAVLFSAKSFAAAMLAYYLSLRIGLPKPFWAIVTVYIVSQTSAGASLSRGVYRFVGTFIGAIATVVIVPRFVNEPMLCSLMLAGWIGLCLFFSLLDRTPRAYAFVLAGYTASLIGFPSVLDPGAVFDTASLRVQEISIGILCAVLIHRYVLPRPITGPFMARLAATLRDARRLAGDALKATPRTNRHDRHLLSVDLLTLDGLATHLPYDPGLVSPRRETVRLIHDRLARLLPLSTEIEHRVRVLGIGQGQGKGEDRLTRLVADTEAWISNPAAAHHEAGEDAAPRLIEQARSVHHHLAAGAVSLNDRIGANLAGHLMEMIGLLHDCDRLTARIADPVARKPCGLHGPQRGKGYIHHRDPWMAARATLGAMVGILAGCAFWIGSGWPEGALAVSILGVCCTLFGNFDAPAPFVVKYIHGSVYGVAVSLIYGFVVLPRTTDFAVLIAVLAPACLLAGSLQARLQTTFMALGITLTLPILAGLGPDYSGDFAASVNAAIALFAAVGFGAFSMSLLQTVPADLAVSRLLRLSRADVVRRARGGGPDEAHWTSLMVDRTALLIPRLHGHGKQRASVLDEIFRHLRIGHVAGRLRRALPPTDSETRGAVEQLLNDLAASFSARQPPAPDDLAGLEDRIAALVGRLNEDTPSRRRSLLDALIDLRFALESGAPIPGGKTHS
ncbi:FUSC family protein [Alloalcanivorax sp. C16-1]|uniref:FUSC family protein n=1 Tax=Alloalcanivorax sp. C16-1 TaxID=3390051 RepID=UPI003970F4C4